MTASHTGTRKTTAYTRSEVRLRISHKPRTTVADSAAQSMASHWLGIEGIRIRK